MLGSLTPAAGMGGLGSYQQQAKYKERYALFRGWLYSAINAIAQEAAGQPVCVGRMKGAKPKEEERSSPSVVKNTMPTRIRTKAAEHELEIFQDHILLDVMERPNPIQDKWQFTYMFIANLALTGWAYVIADRASDNDGRMDYYCLPTTWVHPDHTEGPFSKFRISNPRKPGSMDKKDMIGRENVAFAYLPNPSDPLAALAPVASQMMAVRINDHIETSREQFFHNGIFPSVIVTVGKQPFGEEHYRPRLTAVQRRQVDSVIAKWMTGTANYGKPAIVDGLIEDIKPLSMTQTEMGWEKSEASVKANILSAYCVHPYILGEVVKAGSYAQVANIEKRFFKRVNTYLDMLSSVMTNFVGTHHNEEKLLVWWEKAAVEDQQLRNQMMLAARKNDDITQNELRAELGYGPEEDRNEAIIGDQTLHAVINLLRDVGAGKVTADQVQAVLEARGLPDDYAKRIAGEDKTEQEEATEALEEATEQLREPVAVGVERMATKLLEHVR
jgi:phage portal protein BeeE